MGYRRRKNTTPLTRAGVVAVATVVSRVTWLVSAPVLTAVLAAIPPRLCEALLGIKVIPAACAVVPFLLSSFEEAGHFCRPLHLSIRCRADYRITRRCLLA